MKYKILILSNKDNEEIIEDIYLKERFKKDGNICDIKWVDYDEKLDDYYDVIIRRNTWVGNGKDTVSFQKLDNSLIDRLKSKNIKTVNLLSLTKPIIVILPVRATSMPEEAGAAFEIIIGIPTRITLISMSAGILPLYEI